MKRVFFFVFFYILCLILCTVVVRWLKMQVSYRTGVHMPGRHAGCWAVGEWTMCTVTVGGELRVALVSVYLAAVLWEVMVARVSTVWITQYQDEYHAQYGNIINICKHTATRIRICRFPPGECFLALGFALLPMSYSLQSQQRPQPDPRTLDEYGTPLINTGQPTLYNIFSMVCYIIAIILFQCGTK